MNNISLIAAVSNNWVIGNDGQMPWKQSDDVIRFKKLTSNHIVIMGRKTYKSLGGNLSDRINIVITRGNFSRRGCYTASSIEDALELSAKIITDGWFKNIISDEIFVIGGGEIYKQFLPLSNKIYLTRINCDIEGDTHFPKIGLGWTKINTDFFYKDNRNEYDYSYEDYIKIKES